MASRAELYTYRLPIQHAPRALSAPLTVLDDLHAVADEVTRHTLGTSRAASCRIS